MALDSYPVFVPCAGVYGYLNAVTAASGTDRRPDCVAMRVTTCWPLRVMRLTLNFVSMVGSFGLSEMTL